MENSQRKNMYLLPNQSTAFPQIFFLEGMKK